MIVMEGNVIQDFYLIMGLLSKIMMLMKLLSRLNLGVMINYWG